VSSRRARSSHLVASAGITDMTVPARVAWSYLACLGSALVTGLVVVISNAVVAPALCGPSTGDTFGDCKLAWLIWVGIIGFVVCLLPAVLVLRLGAWVWAAALAGFAFLVAAGAVDQWWWWLLALMVPAVAALVSAEWQRGPGLRWAQRALILLLDAAAAVTLVVWYRNG